MAAPQPTYRKTFIREWRKFRGLTLDQVTSRLEQLGGHEVGAGHLSMLERGQRAYTQATLEALADALRTDVASLLMRDPTAPDALWSIWDQAKPGERRNIEKAVRAAVKRAASK
jgi:transcriptional regulator with XRE-family HTH domain